MNFLQRLTRRLIRAMLFVALAVVLLASAVLVIGGFTAPGGNMIAGLVEKFASNDERIISIAPPGPLLTGRLHLPSVTVGDRKGTYLEATEIVIDWTPSALLGGTFKARSITAERVALSRTPEPSATPPEDSGSSSLPVRIVIDKIDLKEVALGEALTGTPIDLAVSGSANLSETSFAGDVAANRLGMPDARLNARVAFAPAENRLDLDLDVAEPRNGMVAGMLRLPGEPALDLTLKGDGPLSDWKGRLTAALEGQQTLVLEASHQAAGEGLHDVTARGSGRFEALLPPNLRGPFAGDTQIDIAARISDQGQLDIGRGTLTSASLSLSATGRFDPAGANDLSVQLKSMDAPVPLEWPLEEGSIRTALSDLALSVRGPSETVALDVSANLAFADLPQGRFEGLSLTASADRFNLTDRTGAILTEVSVDRSRFTAPDLDRALRAPAKINAPLTVSDGEIAFEGLTLESASIGGSTSGRYDLSTGGVNAAIKLFALPDVLPPGIAERFSETIALEGNLAFVSPGSVSLDNLALASSLLTASGSARFDGAELVADLAGELKDIGDFVPNSSGAAQLTVSTSGPLSALSVNAKVSTAEGQMAGYTLDALNIDVSGVADPNALSADIAATGRIDGKEIAAQATLLPRDGHTEIPDMSVSVGPNTASGALTLDAGFMPEGTVTFDFPDISLLAAFAGQQAEGNLKGQVTLDATGARKTMSIAANGTTLRRDGITLSSPQIALTISDLATLAADGTVKAGEIAAGANRIEQPSLTFDRQGNATQFDFAARYDAAPLRVAGAIRQDGDALSLDLASFASAPRGIAVTLAQPTSIALSGGAAELRGLSISAGRGTVTVSGRAGETLDVTADIANLPASLVDRFASGLGAAGTISGKVTAKGAATAPTVGYNLSWSNASVTQLSTAGLPPVNVTADGTFTDQRLQLNLALTGQGALSVNGGGSLSLSGNRPIDMRFNGNVPFALFANQLAAQGFTAEGSASLSAGISGTLSAPAFSGTISASGARLVDVRRNLAVEGLAFEVALGADRVTISSLRGNLAGGGSISGSGSIDVRSAGLPADIALTLNQASYIDGTMVATTAGGNLRLTGPLLSSPQLSGNITLDNTSITVPERLPPSLAEIDVTHRNAPAEVRSQLQAVTRQEGGGGGSQINLDLTVDAGSQIFVRGRGIDAELGGALTVRGTTAEPSVAGAFTLRRGRLSILNKRLDFTSGTITFGGGLVPILDMEATTTSGSTTITISIAGIANDPAITFSSAPALPQDEVLAQLIFGQSMSRLSPLQIAQLADSVSQLAGGRSTSLFQSLRSGLGIDDLDVGTDEQGRARVTAGKYLNDRTYLELQQDADTGGKAIINLDVGRGLKLRGEAGGDGSGGAGIFYEKEY